MNVTDFSWAGETERSLSLHAWDVFHEIRFKEVAHVFFFSVPVLFHRLRQVWATSQKDFGTKFFFFDRHCTLYFSVIWLDQKKSADNLLYEWYHSLKKEGV